MAKNKNDNGGIMNRSDGILIRIYALSNFKVQDSNIPFICQECGKAFKKLRDLTFHITTTKDHSMTKEQQKDQNKKVVQFFNWAFKNGDESAEKLEYIPLPANLKDDIRSYWKKNGIF